MAFYIPLTEVANMKKLISDGLRVYFVAMMLAVPVLSGCAWLNPGTEGDQGEAVGAPTEPEGVDDAYEEGAGYPEEDEDQSF